MRLKHTRRQYGRSGWGFWMILAGYTALSFALMEIFRAHGPIVEIAPASRTAAEQENIRILDIVLTAVQFSWYIPVLYCFWDLFTYLDSPYVAKNYAATACMILTTIGGVACGIWTVRFWSGQMKWLAKTTRIVGPGLDFLLPAGGCLICLALAHLWRWWGEHTDRKRFEAQSAENPEARRQFLEFRRKLQHKEDGESTFS